MRGPHRPQRGEHARKHGAAVLPRTRLPTSSTHAAAAAAVALPEAAAVDWPRVLRHVH